MSLKYFQIHKAVPNEIEAVYLLAWDIVSPEVERLLNKGWEYELVGKKDLALQAYQGANIYYYLLYYSLAIRTFILTHGELFERCNLTTTNARCRYAVDCVLENLPCLSTFYGTDYREALDKIFEAFGIDTHTDCVTPGGPHGEFTYLEHLTENFTKPQL